MDILNTIAQQLHRRCYQIGSTNSLPPIRQILISTGTEEPEKSTKFGALILADGTVGITYVGIDQVWLDLQEKNKYQSLLGASPIDVIELYIDNQGWQRVLGMAAINAISQWYFGHTGTLMHDMPPLTEVLAISAQDHIGMVGFYPPLVEQLKLQQCRLTVLELDPRWLQSADGFEVTLDQAKIYSCNKIICTGTTLVNHSLEKVLDNCHQAKTVCLMGPTAGCIPEPLFERGVTMIASCRVIDTAQFIQRWTTGERWRGSTAKYLITKDQS